MGLHRNSCSTSLGDALLPLDSSSSNSPVGSSHASSSIRRSFSRGYTRSKSAPTRSYCRLRVEQMLQAYFTWRVPIPWVLLVVLRRTDKYIARLGLDEGDRNMDLDAPGITPLHPKLSVRMQLTTLSVCELVSDMLVFLHCFVLVLRLALHADDAQRYCNVLLLLSTFSIILEVQFLLEVIAKWYVCRRSFFHSKLQVLDAVTTLIVWIAAIMSFAGVTEDAVTALRLCRAFRLYHRLHSFTLLLQVLSQVGPALVALLGVLFLLLYMYSMIGMMFFCNELVPGSVSPDFAYDAEDFYVINFNDLAHSMVALFYQLIINDW